MGNREPIGEVLKKLGYISVFQLTEALEFQERLPPGSHMPVGDILVDFGYITPEQLSFALDNQKPFKRIPLGQILLDKEILKEWQLSHALRVQHSLTPEQYKKIGYILVELEYVTQSDVDEALKIQGCYDE